MLAARPRKRGVALPRPLALAFRLLDRFGLIVRHVATHHTPWGPSYDHWARRLRRAWAEVRGLTNNGAPLDSYESWLELNSWTVRTRRHLRSRLDAAPGLPRLSVVMPVHDPPPSIFDETLASLASQELDGWQLCLADDASQDPRIRARLRRLADEDPRVRHVRLDQHGGIAVATNAAAARADGDYLVFLDHDDVLHPAALAEVALALAQRPDADMLYTDEDKLDAKGVRHSPRFKPDWSPELLLSYMYVGHLLVIRRALFKQLGGCREGYDGSQDHDLALRVAEHTSAVVHLPLVLYHWRAWQRSVAADAAAKPGSFEAGRRAVEGALARRGAPAAVTRPRWAELGRLGIYRPQFGDEGPEVAILIPTRDRADLLRRCLRSLQRTSYRNYRVVVVDNGSHDAGTLRLLRQQPHRVLRIPSQRGRFSFAALMNEAARLVVADYLLLLNDDTQVISPRWLSHLVGWARLPGVGAVGAKLLYPDGRIQHAGVVHGADAGLPGHAFRGQRGDDPGYLALAAVARNCSAVTAACMLTPRPVFLDMGGFDEAHFPVAYNDVDYGDRLRARGLRVVYCPSAVLRHAEGASRSPRDDPAERSAMRRRCVRPSDPFLNPNLRIRDGAIQILPCHPLRDGPKPLRAAFWTHELTRTGAPLHLLELVTALRARGTIEPQVFSFRDGPLTADYETRGISLRIIPPPLPADFENALGPLARELRSAGAEVAFVNTLEAFAAVEAAERAGLPCVINVHEADPDGRYLDRWPECLSRRLPRVLRWPYRIVFASEAARRSLVCFDLTHRSSVIHSACAPERLEAREARQAARARLRWAPRDVVFLTLGTLCERKGQRDLVGAIACLPESLLGTVRVVLVGDGEPRYERTLRRAAEALPPERRGRLEIHEETPDPVRYLQAADVLVCTSRIESFPRTILEGMAFSLPILTTPVLGIREQVQEGGNALFYRPGGTRELARSMARLANNSELRARLGAASPHVLASLGSFEAMVDGFEELLREAWATGDDPP